MTIWLCRTIWKEEDMHRGEVERGRLHGVYWVGPFCIVWLQSILRGWVTIGLPCGSLELSQEGWRCQRVSSWSSVEALVEATPQRCVVTSSKATCVWDRWRSHLWAERQWFLCSSEWTWEKDKWGGGFGIAVMLVAISSGVCRPSKGRWWEYDEGHRRRKRIGCDPIKGDDNFYFLVNDFQICLPIVWVRSIPFSSSNEM